jgi:hypothetical protein
VEGHGFSRAAEVTRYPGFSPMAYEVMAESNMVKSYRCTTCGKIHEGLPMSFAAEFPDQYANMSREERDARAVVGSDQCIIDQQWFFIRGCLEIPTEAANHAPACWVASAFCG